MGEDVSYLDEEAPRSGEDLAGIRSRLTLIDLASLLTYESTDQQRVSQIFMSLQRTQQLVSPIIVDLGLGLLVDGHHRVEAFRRLGLKHIPAYAIDYRSAAVDVRGWSRATIAAESDVAGVFHVPDIGARPRGRWSVALVNHDRDVIDQRWFKEPGHSAEFLARFACDLASTGLTVTLEPTATPTVRGQFYGLMDPVIGKDEVIHAAQAGKPFPREVNRHLVDGRPVGMSIPLASLSRQRDFYRHVDHLFEHCSPELADPGVHHDGRQYDERVTLFAPADAALPQVGRPATSPRPASMPSAR